MQLIKSVPNTPVGRIFRDFIAAAPISLGVIHAVLGPWRLYGVIAIFCGGLIVAIERKLGWLD
jgi:hypothetical protein